MEKITLKIGKDKIFFVGQLVNEEIYKDEKIIIRKYELENKSSASEIIFDEKTSIIFDG